MLTNIQTTYFLALFLVYCFLTFVNMISLNSKANHLVECPEINFCLLEVFVFRRLPKPCHLSLIWFGCLCGFLAVRSSVIIVNFHICSKIKNCFFDFLHIIYWKHNYKFGLIIRKGSIKNVLIYTITLIAINKYFRGNVFKHFFVLH